MLDAPALVANKSGATMRQRAPAARAKPKPSRQGEPRSLLRRALARPGVTVAGAAFAALMTGIVVNAMLFQKGHHPAPLFGGASQSAVTKAVAAAPAPVPAQPAAPSDVAAADPAPAAVPTPQPAARSTHAGVAPHKAHPRPSATAKATAATPHRKDAIGQLLGGTDTHAEADHKPRKSKTARSDAQ